MSLKENFIGCPSPHNKRRALVSAVRSIKSAFVALALVEIPSLLVFIQSGHFNRAAWLSLAQSSSVAALMALGNYFQRLRECETRPRRPLEQRDIDYSKPPER